MIRDHYETRWGSIELVRATLALLDDALRDDPALVAEVPYRLQVAGQRLVVAEVAGHRFHDHRGDFRVPVKNAAEGVGVVPARDEYVLGRP